jgi:hypothetical protein
MLLLSKNSPTKENIAMNIFVDEGKEMAVENFVNKRK